MHPARRSDARRREHGEVPDVGAAVDERVAVSKQVRIDPRDLGLVLALVRHVALQGIALVELELEAALHADHRHSGDGSYGALRSCTVPTLIGGPGRSR